MACRFSLRVMITMTAALSGACGGPEGTGDGSGSSSGSTTGASSNTQTTTADDSGSVTTTVGTTMATTVDTSGSATTGSEGGSSSATETATESGGDCPDGCSAPFQCAPGGYCASESGVPQFDHVYVAIFENRSLDTVMGNAPYLDGLAAMGAYATAYNSVAHPSLPNYIAMTSGSTQGIACDCHPGDTNDCDAFSCNIIVSTCDCPSDVEHLGDQLDAAAVMWREYGEGMGTPCNGTDSNADHYAAKHIPFLYYTNVWSDDVRCQERVRDYSDFAADLEAGTYRFSMISPDLCDDMHDTCGGNAVTHGDDWASTNLAAILATDGFAPGGHDVLFIVWDEQDNSIGNAPIPFIVVSPLIDAGTVTDTVYDHYSLLATWEDGFGLPRLGMAADAQPIADIWK